MNILKVLGVAVGIHAIVLIIVLPGCRSNTARREAATITEAAAAAPASRATPASELNPGSVELAPIALNLPFAQAPSPAGDRYAPTRPGTPAAAEVQPAATYTVKKGDSFALIARKHGITLAALTAANNTVGNAMLRPGQKLVIPNKAAKSAGSSFDSGADSAMPVAEGGTYTVKSGDTLSKIASRHHTTLRALRALNGLSGDNLRIGQILQVPGKETSGMSGPVLPPPPAAPLAVVSAAPAASGPGVHTVSQGESAESIARRYKITVGELARANQLTDPRKIRIGQLLTIPGAGAAAASKPAPSLVPELAPAPALPISGPAVESTEPEAADAPVIQVDEPPSVVPASHRD